MYVGFMKVDTLFFDFEINHDHLELLFFDFRIP